MRPVRPVRPVGLVRSARPGEPGGTCEERLAGPVGPHDHTTALGTGTGIGIGRPYGVRAPQSRHVGATVRRHLDERVLVYGDAVREPVPGDGGDQPGQRPHCAACASTAKGTSPNPSRTASSSRSSPVSSGHTATPSSSHPRRQRPTRRARHRRRTRRRGCVVRRAAVATGRDTPRRRPDTRASAHHRPAARPRPLPPRRRSGRRSARVPVRGCSRPHSSTPRRSARIDAPRRLRPRRGSRRRCGVWIRGVGRRAEEGFVDAGVAPPTADEEGTGEEGAGLAGFARLVHGGIKSRRRGPCHTLLPTGGRHCPPARRTTFRPRGGSAGSCKRSVGSV